LGTRTPGLELVERIDLGILPGGFLLLASKTRALTHGARLATAAHLAAFLVACALLEAPLRHVSIDLGTARVHPGAHQIHRGFLAALERADDFVDHTIIDQGLQSGRCLHKSLQARLGNDPVVMQSH